MKFSILLKIAFLAMLKNKMRSLLTMLGIIIGVSAVIVMVAIGHGTKKQIETQINSLGVNLLTVFPGAFRQGGVSMGGGSASRLTLDDVEKLKKEGTLLAGVSPVIRVSLQAVGGLGNWNTSVMGVSPDYQNIRQWPILEGEFFSDADVRGQSKVCVIGQTVATNLFGSGDPVGQKIRLRNVPFKVIGLLTNKGQNSFGSDQDDTILAPYTTVQFRLNYNKFIQQIVCSSQSADQMSDAEKEINSILRESHKLSEGADEDFTIRNQAEVVSTANQTTGFLTTFLVSIAGISLLVGGIGIMNIMLVSVTERTREIGIRMAVGAKESDILKQFLVESVVLSVSGGLIGIILGFLISLTIRTLAGWATELSMLSIILAFSFSAFVGIFFGFYPARKAAKLNPIEALRYE
jgi:putative ABC transport system permease protein